VVKIRDYLTHEVTVSAREEDSSFPRTLGRERTTSVDFLPAEWVVNGV
jgi:hypothetical protein